MSDTRIEQLQQFLERTPADPFLHHAIALEYVKQDDDDQAEDHFRNNLEQSPEYIATYYHLGKLLERSGNIDEAITVYEKGMQVAKEARDMHTYNELQAAYEDIAY